MRPARLLPTGVHSMEGRRETKENFLFARFARLERPPSIPFSLSLSPSFSLFLSLPLSFSPRRYFISAMVTRAGLTYYRFRLWLAGAENRHCHLPSVLFFHRTALSSASSSVGKAERRPCGRLDPLLHLWPQVPHVLKGRGGRRRACPRSGDDMLDPPSRLRLSFFLPSLSLLPLLTRLHAPPG